jgi:hypothetical protein
LRQSKPAALAAPCPLSGKKNVVFARDLVRVERTALGIAGGLNEVVEAVQDEASPTPLPGEPPKAKNILLGESQSLLRAHFPKAQELGRRHPRDGRAQTVAAFVFKGSPPLGAGRNLHPIQNRGMFVNQQDE